MRKVNKLNNNRTYDKSGITYPIRSEKFIDFIVIICLINAECERKQMKQMNVESKRHNNASLVAFCLLFCLR